MVNYILNSIVFQRDSSGNYTGLIFYYSGSGSSGNTISGQVHITEAQLASTGGQVSTIVGLIGPAVQAVTTQG